MDSLFVHTVGLNSSSHSDQVFVNVSVGTSNNSSEIDCKIDTGSQIKCLPISIYRPLKLDFPLKPSNATLTAHSGDRLSVRGKVLFDCMYKSRPVNTEFNVVESSAPPLLSLKTSLDLGLIKLTHSIGHSSGEQEKKNCSSFDVQRPI